MKPAPALILSATLSCLLTVVPSAGQTELVSTNFFPAESEFRELQEIRSETVIEDPAKLGRLDRGDILLEAGLNRYAQRAYSLSEPGSFEIEIFTFQDARGAYSLLTLFADSPIQAGPPGNSYSSGRDLLMFVSGSRCTRIRSGVGGDLALRVAKSVANRMGNRDPGPPNLLKRLPTQCNAASMRYFLGPKAVDAFGSRIGGSALRVPADVEVVQARCEPRETAGELTLLSFPTIALAEDYFNSDDLATHVKTENVGIFTRQTGPLVGILDGNLSPESADKTLGAIEFSYSIKWIFDRTRQQTRTIWGVPIRLLGTVVRSLLFTVLLCLLSIVAGIILAAGRLYVRRRWVRSADEAFIRLKINED